MNKTILDMHVRNDRLRPRTADKERAKSLIKAAESNASVVKTISLSEDSATVVFREIYESIRQLGEARWMLSGYEPSDHEITLEILKELKIKNSAKLNHLNRFKKIRNDANYRGFKVSLAQAKEIIDFWDETNKEIIKILSDELLAGSIAKSVKEN